MLNVIKMIRDYTTGKTKFVKIKISAPDGRFERECVKGGIDKKTAIYEAKKFPKRIIIDIFDSEE